ncbi:DUF6401 family natural product biosynthesis protein [Paractinoplanes rhizophilus]|jgi:hypothetical protein|uniref:DUF6401 family natural product biosynthesis protein n=1 Tax=Paractinoplanes rhizophilus TaxID=1416877 RepID=A0ABW2HQ23_9ACTN|nr:DUF6401 family natural product biosynthesis protein [Actinoplanes sp.]
MTNEFLAFAPISADAVILDPAVAQLDEMMARVGVDGLAAAFADPGLLALVDQHAAAVRDALAGAERPIDAEALSAYARSIVAAARRAGRFVPAAGEAPTHPADWQSTDWHVLRLVAVCLLADDAGAL